MADADQFPGIVFTSIMDGILALLLYLILFKISTSCWSFEFLYLTLLESVFIFFSTIVMLAASLGSHQTLFSYFLMKLVLTVVFIIFVIASWNVGEGNWGQMKDCLRKVEFCQDDQVSSSKMLNPIFIACCKKPASCNSSSADENSSFYNPSCHLWSTNSTILCYDCQLCRDPVLDDFRLRQKSSAILPFWGFSYHLTSLRSSSTGREQNAFRPG